MMMLVERIVSLVWFVWLCVCVCVDDDSGDQQCEANYAGQRH